MLQKEDYCVSTHDYFFKRVNNQQHVSPKLIIILVLSCIKLSLTLLSILWILAVLVQNQSKGKGARASFLTSESERTALNVFPRELKNMHLLSLACTCNLLFATRISDFANLLFWSDNMGYMHSVASNLSLVFDPHPSFLQGISCLQTPLLIVEFFGWLFPVSTHYWLGREFLTEKVLNEMEFRILLLCPKFWDPMLFSSRFLQNISVFLLMEHLEFFLTRIIFLSMGEFFLIPTELVFLDLNPCWRRFFVE